MYKLTLVTFVSYLFVLLLILELFLFPLLYLGEYGMSFNYHASYFLRFFYLGYVSLFLLYVVATQRLRVNALSIVFLLSLAIAVIRSMIGIENEFSMSAFYSHIFYLVMPILAMSFGMNFYGYTARNSDVFTYWVKFLAIWGGIVVGCFYLIRVLGYSVYDSVDLWNSLIGASYLMQAGGGVLYISVLSVFFAQKRTAIAVVCIIFFLFLGSKYKVRYAAIAFMLFGLVLVVLYQTGTGFSRLDNTFTAIANGDLQFVFSGRVEEAQQVIKELAREELGSLLGLGLGVQYYPWPDLPGSEDYLSHSAHIGYFSYALIVGYPMATCIFFLIANYSFRIFLCLKNYELGNHEVGMMLLFLTFLIASLVGGSMVNNPIFWVLLGCNIQILRLKKGVF